MSQSTATLEPVNAVSPSQACRSCGHSYRDHSSGAGCRHRDSDGDFCDCSLFSMSVDDALRAVADPNRQCRTCGHEFTTHHQGYLAGCQAEGPCSCESFLSRPGSDAHVIVEAMAAVARTKDQFIHWIDDGKEKPFKCDPPLPAPIRLDCPDHPTWPLAIKGGRAFCLFGGHTWESPSSRGED